MAERRILWTPVQLPCAVGLLPSRFAKQSRSSSHLVYQMAVTCMFSVAWMLAEGHPLSLHGEVVAGLTRSPLVVSLKLEKNCAKGKERRSRRLADAYSIHPNLSPETDWHYSDSPGASYPPFSQRLSSHLGRGCEAPVAQHTSHLQHGYL